MQPARALLIDSLRLGELRLAHGNLLARVAIVQESSPLNPSQLGGAYKRAGMQGRNLNHENWILYRLPLQGR